MLNKTLFVTALCGLVGFLYPLYQFMQRINDWSIFTTPPGVGELLFCVTCGLIAIGASLGVDIKQIIGIKE